MKAEEKAEKYASEHNSMSIHLSAQDRHLAIGNDKACFLDGYAEGRRDGIRETIELIQQAGHLIFSATSLSAWIEQNLLTKPPTGEGKEKG